MKTLSYTASRARHAEVLDSVVDGMRSPATPIDSSTRRSTSRPSTARSTIWSTPIEGAAGLGRQRVGDHLSWQAQYRKVLERINPLIQDIQRNGNAGTGVVRIAACRHHYGR